MTSNQSNAQVLKVADIESGARDRIFEIRDQRVVLDSDLAHFYGIETKRLMEQVRRNSERFPEDFMFRLSSLEAENLRSQIATSSFGHGGRRQNPHVFTEQGALAVSGVIRSDRAAEVGVAIARAFVAMRDQLASIENHPVVAQLASRLSELEAGSKEQRAINQVITECMAQLRPILDAIEDETSDPDLS